MCQANSSQAFINCVKLFVSQNFEQSLHKEKTTERNVKLFYCRQIKQCAIHTSVEDFPVNRIIKESGKAQWLTVWAHRVRFKIITNY